SSLGSPAQRHHACRTFCPGIGSHRSAGAQHDHGLRRMLTIMLTAIGLDAIVLAVFASLKWQSDPMIVVVAFAIMACVLIFEHWFLQRTKTEPHQHDHNGH
ncbi:hypothetical protein ACRARE_22125, partial [Pseudooceanicola sp. 200-1SW]